MTQSHKAQRDFPLAFKELAKAVIELAFRDALQIYRIGARVRIKDDELDLKLGGKRDKRPKYKRVKSMELFRASEPYQFLANPNPDKAYWCGFLDLDDDVLSEIFSTILSDEQLIEEHIKATRDGHKKCF